MSTDWLGSQDFWKSKRALVMRQHGAGFLGSYIVETLRVRERGCGEVFVPRSKDCDLTQLPAMQKLYADARPDIVIHLAARVGGIARQGSADNFQWPALATVRTGDSSRLTFASNGWISA